MAMTLITLSTAVPPASRRHFLLLEQQLAQLAVELPALFRRAAVAVMRHDQLRGLLAEALRLQALEKAIDDQVAGGARLLHGGSGLAQRRRGPLLSRGGGDGVDGVDGAGSGAHGGGRAGDERQRGEER